MKKINEAARIIMFARIFLDLQTEKTFLNLHKLLNIFTTNLLKITIATLLSTITV